MKGIFGIGVDIIEVDRFSNIDPVKFSKRILSDVEMLTVDTRAVGILFLAKKFSIKESVAKALGVGIGQMLSFKDITIYKEKNGKPVCFVSDDAIAKIVKSDVQIDISVSDSKTMIASYCVVSYI